MRQSLDVRVLVLLLSALIFATGCGGIWQYTPQSAQEQLDLIKASGTTGCFYLRSNLRPYSDTSMMYIGTYGKDGPKWDKCLELIPAEARAFIRQGP